MNRPVPTGLYHFTHLDNLSGITRDGLLSDSRAHEGGRLTTEVGNRRIKSNRKLREVDVGPGGIVADYVPFYFAPRSPMLYAIRSGNVPTYAGGQQGLVYLCTTLERIQEISLSWVASDRNAVLTLARFTDDLQDIRDDTHVPWPLMLEKYWNATEAEPDRKERRQAELLVHQGVPWSAIMFVGARDQADLSRVQEVLGTLDVPQPRSDVRRDWYF